MPRTHKTKRQTRLCSVEHCGRPSSARGYCNGHYEQYRRGNTITPLRKKYSVGERYVREANGYEYERVLMPGGKTQHVAVHKIVMEQLLGRVLLPGENVHHINGIKYDNRPENLELWVTSQPPGQRPEDLLAWADEIIRRYRD